MNPKWKKALAALAAVLTLQSPAMAAGVMIGDRPVGPEQGWVENGTSYVTLRAYAQEAGFALRWDGSRALLTGEGMELWAAPGQIYVTVNGRPIYVEQGVRVEEGRIVLPLRTLARATGGTLSWNAAEGVARLGLPAAPLSQTSYEGEDLYWLSRVISAESRGEPLMGQIAVGNVVLNRVKSGKYPNTVKGVVFDTRGGVQFEPIANGTIYNEPTQSAVLAAKLCLEGANVVGDCLYFYAPALSAGTWIVNNCTYYTTIGCHRFYLG